MALTDCFIQPGQLQGLITCLRESENLTGVAVVACLLAVWLTVQLMAQRRCKAQQRLALPGIPVVQHMIRFADKQHAEAVHSFANRELYQLLLTEMGKALTDAGYAMTRDEAKRMTISEADRQIISRRIFRARQCYITPRVSEQTLKDSEDAAVNDGYAGTWLSVLIRANEAQGWYVSHNLGKGRQSWQDMAWPVKQVVITVSASASVLTRDIVRVLTEASSMLQQMDVQEWDGVVRKPVPVTTPGVQAELVRQSCSSPPGFFPAPAGHDVPASLENLTKKPAHDAKRAVSVFVQVTKRRNTRDIVKWLMMACERLEAGELYGADYDDDNGYAFIVSSASDPD